jgi:hypothetical protein
LNQFTRSAYVNLWESPVVLKTGNNIGFLLRSNGKPHKDEETKDFQSQELKDKKKNEIRRVTDPHSFHPDPAF